jgi:hypothetical protein
VFFQVVSQNWHIISFTMLFRNSMLSGAADTEHDGAEGVRLAAEDDRNRRRDRVIPIFSITRRDLAFAGTVNDTNWSKPSVWNP